MDKTIQDLAWSRLPTEFKEEVSDKYIYACEHCEEPYWYGVKTELECFFGIDNLTSAAEGDEMLMVSRKQVQEEYAILSKELSHRETDAEDYIAWNYAKMTFEELFGSKCLPDNKCQNGTYDCENCMGKIVCESSPYCQPDGYAKGQKPAEPTLFNIESDKVSVLNYALLKLERSAKAVREALTKTNEK